MVKEAAMTKTLIEIDDEYLAAAQQALTIFNGGGYLV
jgi:Arc/MetJ family transcription regulator